MTNWKYLSIDFSERAGEDMDEIILLKKYIFIYLWMKAKTLKCNNMDSMIPMRVIQYSSSFLLYTS